MVVGLAHTRTHVCASSSHQPTETSTTSIDHHHRRQPATTTTTRPHLNHQTNYHHALDPATSINLELATGSSVSSIIEPLPQRRRSGVVVARVDAQHHHHKHHRGNLAKPAPSLRVPCPSIAITAHDLPPPSCGLLDNHSDATAATTAVRRLRHQAVVPVVDRRRPQVLLASLQGRREQLPTSANHSCPSSRWPRAIVARGTPDAPEPIRRASTRAHGAVLRTGAVLERPAAGGGRVLPAAAADWLHHASAKGSKLASKQASKLSCHVLSC